MGSPHICRGQIIGPSLEIICLLLTTQLEIWIGAKKLATTVASFEAAQILSIECRLSISL